MYAYASLAGDAFFMGKTCSFFGHQNTIVTEELTTALREKVLDLIDNGFTDFIFGGFGNFDDLAYKVVKKIREENANVVMKFCVHDENWLRPSKQPKWLKNEGYDEIIYFSLTYDYWYTRIYYRNCEIINNSDFVIFYCEENKNSGAYKALKHAKLKHKQFINLFK